MTTATFTGALKDAQADQIPRLGHLYWFQVGQIDQTWQEAENLFADAGIDPDLLAKPSKKRAYHSALRSIRQMGSSLQVRILARPLPIGSASFIRHQITIETVDSSSQSLDYHCEMFCQLEKATGDVTFETGAKAFTQHDQEMMDLVELEIQHHMSNITPAALRDFIKYEAKRLNAVACRPKGGIWFVAEEHTDRLKKIHSLVEAFGGECWLHLHPVFDTSSWRSNIADYAEREFDVEMKKHKSEVDAMIKDALDDNGEVKRKVLETKIHNFNKIQGKAQMYEKLLNYRADHLRTEVTEQCERLEAIIRGETDLTASLSYKERKKLENQERRAHKRKEQGESLADDFSEVPF